MMALIVVIHIVASLLLIGIILIQQGRGTGLVEGFSGMESMFGTKTNTFLTRSTAVLSVMFFITCLSLAYLSARPSRSLMKNIKATTPAKQSPTANEQTHKQAAAQTPNTQEQVPEKAKSIPEPAKTE
jgi:preprotein translocase subunit SecG